MLSSKGLSNSDFKQQAVPVASMSKLSGDDLKVEQWLRCAADMSQ